MLKAWIRVNVGNYAHVVISRTLLKGTSFFLNWIFFPVVFRAFGLRHTVFILLGVKTDERGENHNDITKGFCQSFRPLLTIHWVATGIYFFSIFLFIIFLKLH